MKNIKLYKKSIAKAEHTEPYTTDIGPKYTRLLTSARLLKKDKEELQQALEEIAAIYNNAPCGYHSLNDKGVFIHVNDTELQWLGETRTGFEGVKKITDILSAESKKKFAHIFPEFMKTGFLREEEFFFVRKDGSSFPVLINATANYDGKGNYKSSRSVVMDISARKQLEEELLNSHRDLQRKNDALTIANENLFSIYPNPSTRIFTLNSEITNGEISVADLQGKIIFSSKINSTTSTLDLSHQSNGIYFVTIKNEKESSTQKIIIEK